MSFYAAFTAGGNSELSERTPRCAVSSRSQHRCARTHSVSSAAYVRAHRGESCILECPVPRNVPLDPSVDLVAMSPMHGYKCALAGRFACAPRWPIVLRLVFCVLTCCVCLSTRLWRSATRCTPIWMLMFMAARSPRGDTAGLVLTCIPSDM